MDWSIVISAAIAGVITIVGYVFGVRKDRASLVAIYEEVAAKQALRISELQDSIEKAEKEYKLITEEQKKKIDAFEKRIDEYEAGIVLLITQLEANGITPLWKPNSPKFSKK